MAKPPGAVAVKGLKELQRAFAKFEDDLAGDLVMELQEAGDPVRKLTEQYIVGGGGGFPGMSGIAGRSAYLSHMRIGVSRGQARVYVAPAWRSNAGTLQGKILAMQIRWRMEGALYDKRKEIYKQLDDMLDRLSNEWGRAI